MSNGAAQEGGDSHQQEYAAEYITQALYQEGEISEPDETLAGRDFVRLRDLHTARQKGTHWQVWENLRRTAPELAVRVGTPAVNISESLPFAGSEFVWQCFDHDEVGDSELFQSIIGGRALYDHASKSWYLWAGHHWREDKTQEIRLLIAGQLPNQYYKAAAELSTLISVTEDKNEVEKLKKKEGAVLKRIRSIRTVRRISNIIRHLEALLGIVGDEWDKDPWKLACKNGTINLRTGELSPGNPADRIRRAAPVRFEGINTPAPRWEKFISEIFEDEPDIAPFMQRLLGYGITGLTSEHVLPIFHGENGRNGKDTLLESIGAVLGEAAGAVSSDLLIDTGNRMTGQATPHLYRLQGLRMGWVSETRDNARMNTNQVKALSGGGHVVCRPLYGEEISFEATHILILQTNHRPRIPNGGDAAIWERLLLIPFNMRFVENPKNGFERKRDTQLKIKLADEQSGILAWLVRGCLDWQQNGLNAPPVVKAATNEYKTGEDELQRFIDEMCVINENASVGATALHQAYKTFGATCSQTLFGRDMAKHGYEKTRNTSGRMIYVGIGLASDENANPE